MRFAGVDVFGENEDISEAKSFVCSTGYFSHAYSVIWESDISYGLSKWALWGNGKGRP